MLTLGHFVVLQGCLFCPALLIIISLLIRVFVDFTEGVCGRGHGVHMSLGKRLNQKLPLIYPSVCLCVTDKVLCDCVCGRLNVVIERT